MSEPIGNPGYITDLDVRIWLRDTDPAANLLLDDVEFDEREIQTARCLAVDYWNEQPPAIRGANYNIATFPYRYNLLMGTAANLLFIAANRYRRNRMKYSIPGGGVDDQDRASEYDEAGGRFWGQYKDWVTQKKRAVNSERGWDMI